MIPKYRNKAIKKTIIGFVIVVFGLFMFGATAKGEWRQLGQFLCIVSNIIGCLICAFGCVDLLKAKGYDSDMMLAFLIPGICCSLVFVLVAPAVIIFGLKDKTKRR
jgi:hypothetical protein